MRPAATRVIATGTVAGLIGFLATTAGFFLLDLLGGRGAGFTPSLLAASLFQGVTEACDVSPVRMAIAGYTAIHLVVFLVLGWITAWLFDATAKRPWFWSAALFSFIIITFHLYGAVLSLLAPVEGCFSLFQVMGATTLASAAMCAYLLREYRGLTRTLPMVDEE